MICFGRHLYLLAIQLCLLLAVNRAFSISNSKSETINEIVSLSDAEEKTGTNNATHWGSKPSENVDITEGNPESINSTINNSSDVSEWTLVWKDDFDGPAGSLPSADEWLFDIGTSYPGGPRGWGNREAQYYTDYPENVSVDGNGVLRITPIRDAEGNWTSARIETKRTDFKPPENGSMAIEGRIQMPNVTGDAALGYWPAFWALGSPLRGHYYNWPQIGEFDIMENVNGLDAVWGVLHCGLRPNDPCGEPNGIGNKRSCPGSTCQSDFHTYRFEWDRSKEPNEFRWFVDGERYHEVNSGHIDAASWRSMTQHSGYFLLLNVAMGGNFPTGYMGRKTPTDTTESGHSMLIDYVAVYTSNNHSTDE